MRNKLFKSSPVILAIYLFVFGCFYLVTKLWGYTFVPFNEIVLHIVSVAIVILFTVGGIINRAEKTKISTIISAFLPLIAIFFVISKGFSWNLTFECFFTSDENSTIWIPHLKEAWAYFAHSIIILTCSMILFFAYKKRKFIRTILGIISSIVFALALFILFIVTSISSSKMLISSQMSPNSVYLAEVVDWYEGGIWSNEPFPGETCVNITPQNSIKNCFIGKLKRDKDTKWIHRSFWLGHETITLQWETDEILYINGEKYDVTM